MSLFDPAAAPLGRRAISSETALPLSSRSPVKAPACIGRGLAALRPVRTETGANAPAPRRMALAPGAARTRDEGSFAGDRDHARAGGGNLSGKTARSVDDAPARAGPASCPD